MGKKTKFSKNMASGGLLLFIYQKRVPLIAITVAALIVSVIVSLLITPRYRSTVTLYPATFTNMSRSLMGPATIRGDIMNFGEESDAERLLQVMQSETIREKIVEKYNLMEHYEIKEDSRFPHTALNRKYKNNVRSRKTQYMAVEIEVLDTEPVNAAAMANDIAAYADSVLNTMLTERTTLAVEVLEEEYRRQLEFKGMLEDSLRRIRELGVIDYESQAEVLNEAYANAILSRDTESIKLFENKLRVLSTYGGTYLSLRYDIEYVGVRLNTLKSAYDEALINLERQMTYTFIVDKATEAEKKTYPVRSLIVIVSTVAAFLFALFFMLLADALRRQLLVRA
jgi:uncharacterized protein involved in exopolysaccharide biosynthesis